MSEKTLKVSEFFTKSKRTRPTARKPADESQVPAKASGRRGLSPSSPVTSPAAMRRSAAEGSTAHAAETQTRRDFAAPLLRAFDSDYKYGPTSGCDRLQRFERAKQMGLDPPDEIYNLLVEFPDMRQDVFAKYT